MSALHALFSPLDGVSPFAAVTIAALVTALLALVVVRFTVKPEILRRAKGRAVAEVLAIRLFPDDPWVTLRSLGGVFRANLRYLGALTLPLAILLLPALLILAALDARLDRRPLRAGESTTVGAVLEPGSLTALDGLELDAPPGLVVETAPLRIPALGEVDWRVRAVEEGHHVLRIGGGRRPVTKELVVGEGLASLGEARRDGGFITALLQPGEPPIEPGAAVTAVTVDYPRRTLEVLGFRVHWLVAFFLLSLLFIALLKRPFGVEL